MEQPLISIIVPVYNAEPYLDNCLDSIAAQTWENLEVWLVDDGSTDASPALCDARAAADPRFHVLHQANAGVSAARNAALERATGRYLPVPWTGTITCPPPPPSGWFVPPGPPGPIW